MKKNVLKVLIAVMLAVVLTTVLVACNNGVASEEESHQHTFEERWSYDGEYHWHKASCEHADQTRDYGRHTFVGDTCSICQYTKEASPAEKYTVVFDANNGAFADGNSFEVEADANALLEEPGEPTRNGYKFAGWAKDSAGNHVWNFGSDRVNDDLTLYAIWLKKFVVTFNANGGTFENGQRTMEQEVYKGDLIAPIQAPDKDDFIFTGWYLDGNGQTEWDFTTDTVSQNITLYAGWEQVIVEHNVTFVLNYEGAETVVKSTEDGLITFIPTRPNYVFNGWWYSDGRTDDGYILSRKFNTAQRVTEDDLRLYAEWVEKSRYGTQLSAPSVSIDGSTLTWDDVANATGYNIVVYKSGTSEELSNQVVRSRSWYFPSGYEAGYYNIQIRSLGDGANTINSAFVSKSYAHKILGTISDFSFDMNTSVLRWSEIKNAATYELYVNDKKVEELTYTTFDMSDYEAGSYSIKIIASRSGYQSSTSTRTIVKKRLKTPTGIRLAFRVDTNSYVISWGAVAHADTYILTLAGQTVRVTDGTSYTISASNNVWGTEQTIVITMQAFDSMADYLISNTTDDVELTKAYKLEYHKNQENAGNVSASGDLFAPPQTFTVSFDLNGVNGQIDSQVISDENALEYPAIPTRSGYVFRGWYVDSKCTTLYDFSAPITSDMKLFAGWYQAETKVTNTLDIIHSKNTEASAYTISTYQYYSSSSAYVYFSALTSGTYKLYYKNSSSSSSYAAYFNVYNATQGRSVFSNTISNTSYNSLTLSVKAGEIYYIRIYKTSSSSSYYSTISVYVTGAELPAAGGKKVNKYYDAAEESDVQEIYAKYGSEVTLTAETQNNATFDGWYNGDVLLTKELQYTFEMPAQAINYTAKWSFYYVTTEKNIEGAGTITTYNQAAVTVGDSVTLEATTYKGYTWGGWFDGDTKVSEGTELTYTFVMGDASKTYTARFEVAPEMSNYNFTSSITECTITGVIETSVKEITIPDYVTKINAHVFDDCTQLKTVNWNAVNCTTGGSSSDPIFKKCAQLVTVKFGEKVQTIPAYVCNGCTSLQSVTIGESVKNIGTSAFNGCYKLVHICNLSGVSISSPASIDGEVVQTGGAFQHELKKDSHGVWTYTVDKTVYAIGYEGDDAHLDLSLNGSINAIYPYAFDGRTDLQSVTIGESVTSIGKQAFVGCTGITTITIPDRVTGMGDSAFYNCTSLQTVNWNATNCTSAGSSSYPIFKGCTQFATVNIGENVQTIPAYTFYGCTGITKVKVASLKGWCEIAFGNNYANPLYQANYNKAGTAKLYLNDGLVAEVKALDGLTEIPAYAFYGCPDITSVTIPDSVTSIGGGAFCNCTGLQEVTIGAGVTSIAYDGFYNCTGLQTVNWNATNCTSAGSSSNSIFKGRTRLATVNVGANVQKIPAYAFYGCTGITKVNYLGTLKGWCEIAFGNNYANPLYQANYNKAGTAKLYLNDGLVTEVKDLDGLAKIPAYAFYGCTDITTVTIPDNGTAIESSAFSGCTGIKTATYPALAIRSIPQSHLITVTITSGEIGSSAFSGCTSLQSVTIGESVTSIGSSAFSGCTGLQTVYWNATNCTSAGSSSNPIFNNCTQLATVNIGENVQSIPEYTFKGCTGITKVNYLGTLKGWCELVPGSVNPLYEANNNKAGTAKLYLNDGLVTEVKDLDGLIEIPAYAFYGLTDITTVTILDSVTSIGYYAFSGCTGLQSVTIGESVASIGESAFRNCTGLQTVHWNAINCTRAGSYSYPIFKGCTQFATVNIGENVQTIPENAFCDYTGLQEVTIPGSVTSIGSSAFKNCTNIIRVNYERDIKAWCEIAFEDGSSNPLCEANNAKLYVNNEEFAGAVEIPKCITKIGSYAFYGYTGITSITIPDSVTSIGDSAFSGCTGIKTATYPASAIRFIPQSNLTTVTITSGEIGEWAFYNCTGLQSVTIGESVTSIGSSAFFRCTGLQAVNWNATKCTSAGSPIFNNCTQLATVNIGENVQTIPAYAFKGYTGLQEVTIGAEVTSIGDSAFFGCTGLQIVNWDATNCTSAGSSSSPIFKDCTQFATVNIGENVQTIPAYAFKGYTGLQSVIIGESVTSIGDYAFDGCTGIITATCPASVIRSIPQSHLTTVTITSGGIGSSAFSGCTSLQSVTIGEKVASIGEDAFYGCTGITKVNYLGTLKGWCEIAFGNDYANPLYRANYNKAGTAKLYLNDGLVTEVKDLDGLTEIPDYAFYGLTDITAVTILNSVTSIGFSVFSSCKGLRNVTIGESVTSIGSSAFYNCTGLRTVNWNAINCTSAGSSSDPIFQGCTWLVTVNLGANVQTIPAFAFYNCTGLQEVTIPGSVTSIGYYAFYKCTGLQEVTIGDGVTSIGSSAFSGCTDLQEVTIGNGVTNIGSSAFSGCTGLQTVHWNAINCTSAGSYSYPIFNDCTRLATVNIGENVQTIPENAFKGYTGLQTVNWNATNCTSAGSYSYPIFKECTKFTTVNIGENVQTIPAYTFYGCTGITQVNYGGDLKGWCESEFKDHPLEYAKNAKLYVNDTEVTGVVEVPAGTTKIGRYAFCGLTGITSITIPDSVTSIGGNAFYNCTGLQEVTIGAGVTSIGAYAFCNCTGLQEVTIPGSVTSIGYDTFHGCTGLQEVTIPGSVTSIGWDAFSGCTGITKVNYLGTLKGWCEIAVGNYVNPLCAANSNKAGTAKLYLNDGLVTEIKDLDGLSEIPASFYGLTDITTVTIPDSVASIGKDAFYGCTGITKVNYLGTLKGWCEIAFGNDYANPLYQANYNEAGTAKLYLNDGLVTEIKDLDGLTKIPDYAFYGCTDITTVTIPDSVTSIGDSAFSGCTGLREVTIGAGVKSIGGYAFHNCTGLQEVTIGAGVTSIGSYAFSGCTGLREITIPDSVTSIGYYAFYKCTGLQEVTIGAGVTSIGQDAFSGCTGLQEVTIGAGVTSIDEFAFCNCRSLIRIDYQGTPQQWQNLQKGYGWNFSTGSYTVYCTNGTIPKSES